MIIKQPLYKKSYKPILNYYKKQILNYKTSLKTSIQQSIMVQIASQPYLKSYLFPIRSTTFLTRLLLLVITVALPFFIVFKTGNFYQNSKTEFKDISTVNIKPTYQYYINIKTNTKSYVFTNLFINTAYQAINIKFLQKQSSSLAIQIQYHKLLSEKVKEVSIYVTFQYLHQNKNAFGLLHATTQGYDLSESAIVGLLQFRDGTGKLPILKSQDILRANQYDFLSAYQSLYKSSTYLSYKYNQIPINLPTDVYKTSMVVNYPTLKVQQTTPSILGQLIWSWIQYFPIFFVFYIVTEYVWLFLLRQGLLKRTLKHDKDYLQILRRQQDR